MANIDVVNKEILNNLGDYILIVDRDYNIVFANRAMLQLCERKEKDVISQKCHKFSHHCPLPCSKEGKTVICPHREVFKTGKTISVTHTHKLPDRTEKIFDITASPIKDEKSNVIQMAEVLRDVTERKKTEEALDFEHRQLLSIFDSIDEVVYVSDPNTYEVLYANQAIRKVLGDVVGKKCYLVFQGMESPCSFCTNDRIFGKNVGRTYIGDLQNRINKKWYHCIDKAIRWPNGRMVRCEVAIDITKHKMAEELLKESESKFKSLVEHSLTGVYLIQDGVFKYVNPQLAKIFGYSPEELIEKKGPEDLVYPEDWHIVRENLRKRLEGKIESLNYTFGGFKKNGEVFDVEVFGTRIVYKGQPAVIGTLMDITKRFKLENELKKRIKELEEFYDIAIGRELRMVELKEEIGRLKEKL